MALYKSIYLPTYLVCLFSGVGYCIVNFFTEIRGKVVLRNSLTVVHFEF